MATQAETSLRYRIQKLIRARGGYYIKNHGNMTTYKGRSDLSICYKGLALFLEIKTPDLADNVSVEQGIHCRLAKKAGGITAIISTLDQVNYILSLIDSYSNIYPDFHTWTTHHNLGDWDDGTTY